MTTTPTTNSALAHIRHWISRARSETVPDAELLRRFTEEGEESAFALLMDRHGAMVLGTARRVLGDEHLAEDVFQATFLTLARKAGRLRRAAALPAWLHAVACRLAFTTLRSRKRRQRAEAEFVPHASVCPSDTAISQEQLAILDEELSRLPERFRLPLLLCCLEGRSQTEAAVLLGWTPGSVKGRLERGRRRLQDRLVRRGLTVAIAATLPALVRPFLASSLRAAAVEAARPGASLSPLVSALVQEGCKTWLVIATKAIVIVSLLGLVGVGVGVASRLGQSEQTALPTTPPPTDNSKPSSSHLQRDLNALPLGAVARLGWSPLRIGNAAFALTPDGRTIVTVTPQGLVRRFDAKTGRLLERQHLTNRRHVDPVGQFYAQLSADGGIAAIQEESAIGRQVSVWDLTSGERMFRRRSTEARSIGLFMLSPNGKWLATAEHDNLGRGTALRVFDVRTGGMKQLGSLDFNVYDILFSADGKRVVVSQTSSQSGGGSTFACFDVTTEKQLWRVPRKGEKIALSPDGKRLVSAGFDKEKGLGFYLLETDAPSGKPRESFTQYYAAQVNNRMVIAPDNRTVIMNHIDEIVLWDVRARKEIRRIRLPKTETSGYGPDVGAISADSKTLVTNVGQLQRWDLTTGKPFFATPQDDGLAGPVQYVAFTPDGKEVFASSWGLTWGRWDLKTKKRLGFVHARYGDQLIRTPAGLRSLYVSLQQSPYEVTLFDPVADKMLSTIRWTEPKESAINDLRAFALTGNGKTLLVAHSKELGKGRPTTFVTACDAASGRRLVRFDVPGNFWFEKSPFSPCGRWVVIGDKVYDVGSGTALFAPSGELGERLAWERRAHFASVWFSEDGRLMAGLLRKKEEKSATSHTLAVWELATGALLARYPNADFISQAAFAPDGRTLALLDGQGIRLEDLRTGKRLAEFAAPDVTCELTHRGCATQTLVFAPDGSTLATGHLDGTILLWKVPRLHDSGRMALTDDETKKLWTDLGSSSPPTARAAVDRFVGHSEKTIALLAARFRPRRTSLDDKLDALVKDLDSDDFATREEASRQLRTFGAKAEPALRRTLTKAPSLELRRRIEGILAEMQLPPLRLPLSGECLRGARAIEVLERIGNAAARKLLQSWAEQTGDGHLAVEARMALERLTPIKTQARAAEKQPSP